MGSIGASRWDLEDVDPALDPEEPVRAKPLSRRIPAAWHEQDGTWHATLGSWAVRVMRSRGHDAGAPERWEWSGFDPSPRSGPRALRCTGFEHREAAQRDAETTVGALA